MELGEYLSVLRKRWLVIALLALLGGAAGYASTARDTPLYRSTSTVYLTTSRGDSISELSQGANYTANLMQTYARMVTEPVVLEPVIERLGLSMSPRTLGRLVTAQAPLNLYLIDVSVTNSDPAQAAAIANAIAVQLSSTVRDLSPTASDGTSALRMTQVAQAEPARAPFSPRPRLTALMGLAAGLGLGVLVALVLAQLDTRVRSSKDLPRNPVRTVLGQIPRDTTLGRRPHVVVDQPHSVTTESYRRIRTNLQFLDASRPLTSLVVTSSLPGEGKSTTAVNLALVMAEKGAKVLLVDADLRSPSVAALCGLEGAAGLSAVLIHEAELDDVAQPWQMPGLDVVVAGQIPPNPSQLIESRAMEEFITLARERYDLVIIDTAPLFAVTDGAVLARRTDGALVVARSRKVRRPELAEALASIDAVGAPVLGVVLNAVTDGRSDLRYGYGYTEPRRGRGLRRGGGRRRATETRRTRPEPAPSVTPRRSDPRDTVPTPWEPFGDGDEHAAAPARSGGPVEA